ncbi:MAG: hypothetical protein IPI30_08435 [Saprospiraceae bacterium]|nr:hypothetical protein [Candidatus Vicinibacter affinis]
MHQILMRRETKFTKLLKLTFGLFLSFTHLEFIKAQTQVDSTLQRTQDSLAKIITAQPIKIKRGISSSADILSEVDTSNYLLVPYRNTGYISTNNLGAPILAAREGLQFHTMVDHGFHSTDFFHKKFDQLPFYVCSKAYSEVIVSQGLYPSSSTSSLIDNLTVDAMLAASFRHNVHVNVFYNRINHKGIYQNGRNVLSSLGTILQWYNKQQTLGLNFVLVSNTDALQHNNGITNDSFLILDQFRVRESVPVNSTSAKTNHSIRHYGVNGFYKTPLKWGAFRPAFNFMAAYKELSHAFEDASSRSSLSDYGPLFAVDTVGISAFYKQYSWIGMGGIKFFDSENTTLNGNFGFDHNHLLIDSVEKNIFRIRFNGDGKIKISGFELFAHTQLIGNGNRLANLNWVGLKSTLPGIGNLIAKVEWESATPSWQQLYLIANDRAIWENDFKNVLKNNYSIELQPKKSFLPKLQLGYALIDQLIYMDASRKFLQEGRILQHLHLKVNETLTFRRWSSHHELNLHRLSPDPAGWTGWYTYHDLSYKASFFKKATNATFGINAQIYDPTQLFGFHSITLQYYPLSPFSIKTKPIVGAFMIFKVDDFTARIQFEQLDAFWDKKRISFVEGYPVYDFAVRVSIQWKFIN